MNDKANKLTQIPPIRTSGIPAIIKENFYSINTFHGHRPCDGFFKRIDIFIERKLPFSDFHGFFIIRDYLKYFLDDVCSGVIYNGKIVTDLKELTPCFDEYRRGFYNGYEFFEQDQIDYLVGKTFDNIIGRSEHIFNYTQDADPFHKGLITWDGNEETGLIVQEPDQWYRNGSRGGYYYKAWFLLMANYKTFEPFFKALDNKQPKFIGNFSKESLIATKNYICKYAPKDFPGETDEVWLHRFNVDNKTQFERFIKIVRGRKNPYIETRPVWWALMEILWNSFQESETNSMKKNYFRFNWGIENFTSDRGRMKGKFEQSTNDLNAILQNK